MCWHLPRARPVQSSGQTAESAPDPALSGLLSSGGGCTGTQKSRGTHVTAEGSKGTGAQGTVPGLAWSVMERFPKEGVLNPGP